MLSNTYQQGNSTASQQKDPANRLVARMPARRLSFEQARDAWLASSGALDLQVGGKSKPLFDKKNVRDGHYLPWAPTPYITRVDTGTGKATDANVQRVIDLVFGVRTDADVNGIDQVIASGLVPQCAMGVQRAFDGGDLSLFAPPEPCNCYFDAKAPQSTTKCSKCVDDSTCGAGKCRRGYCEVR